MYESEKDELYQAIEAANRAILNLEQAEDYLSRAGDWGILDFMGGELITGIMKHRRMNVAGQELELARQSVLEFKDQLADVDELEDINVDTDDFRGFADLFLDGFLSDWMMQSRIREARLQVRTAIGKIRRIRGQLEDCVSLL
jgi:hypothetical protein